MSKKAHQLSLVGTLMVTAIISGSAVLALPLQASGHANAAAVSSASSESSSGQANASARLTAAKLRSCQNRQQAIQNIMSRIADRGQKQLTLFNGIATKVEAFYTQKGKTLDTYDALVADVTAKQTAAQTAVDTIKTDSTGFSCDSSDPKAFVDSFKSALKSEISALKDYRTSVKNLIVGVKSVQGTTSSSTGHTTSGGTQ